MNRKSFLKSSAVLASTLFLPKFNSFNLFAKDDFTFNEIRNGVGYYFNRGGTIGWINSSDALIVVDSQFPDTAEILYDQLKKVNNKKIDLLFNTHHHGDHTSGNVYFEKYAKLIVANENCVRLQKIKNGGPDKKIITANLTFDKEWNMSIGNEKLYAYHFGNAHTGGDSVIHFQNSNIVHVGDLVFNKVYPWVNKNDEASLSGWALYLEDIIKKFDKDTKFIFGHSFSPDFVVGSVNDLVNMKNYLFALIEYVRSELKKGKKKEKNNAD